MKKVLFTAIAFMAISVAGYANGSENETKKKNESRSESSEDISSEEIIPCTFKIYIRNKDNKIVKTIDYTGKAPGTLECCQWAVTEVKHQTTMLNPMSGYTASHDLEGC